MFQTQCISYLRGNAIYFSQILNACKVMINPKSKIKMIQQPCELTSGSSFAAALLRASNIPGIIGLHRPLLSYLVSFTHVFDTQRNFRVTNECFKHKRILFLCKFFWQMLYTFGESPRSTIRTEDEVLHSNHMSASRFILN